MIKRFFIYGIFGWSIEVIWTGVNSLIKGDLRLVGFTNLWMFFIYGMAVFLEFIHDKIDNWSWLVRGLIWVIIIWGIEYTSGKILVSILGVYPWYYTGPYSVEGLVRLDYAPAWFIAGIIFERIHLALDRYKVA